MGLKYDNIIPWTPLSSYAGTINNINNYDNIINNVDNDLININGITEDSINSIYHSDSNRNDDEDDSYVDNHKLKVFYSHIQDIDDFLRFINSNIYIDKSEDERGKGKSNNEKIQNFINTCKNSLIFASEHSTEGQGPDDGDPNTYLTEIFVDNYGKCTIIGSSRFNVFSTQVKYEILDIYSLLKGHSDQLNNHNNKLNEHDNQLNHFSKLLYGTPGADGVQGQQGIFGLFIETIKNTIDIFGKYKPNDTSYTGNIINEHLNAYLGNIDVEPDHDVTYIKQKFIAIKGGLEQLQQQYFNL